MSGDSTPAPLTKWRKLYLLMCGVLVVISVSRIVFNTASCGACPTQEQAAYFTQQREAAARFLAADRDLVRLVDDVEQSPGSLQDERWRLRDILDRMTFAAEDMVNPEAPAGTEQHQRATVRYSEGQIAANELFWQGALAENAELIYRANARRRDADRLLAQIMAIRASFCQ